MKHTLVPFAMLLVFVGAISQAEDSLEAIHVKIEKYETGAVKKITEWKGKRRHGIWKEWDRDGRLAFEAYYEDGRRVGVFRRWHVNGELWLKGSYRDGKEHGRQQVFDDSGEGIADVYCIDGKPVLGCGTEVALSDPKRYHYSVLVHYVDGKVTRVTGMDHEPISDVILTQDNIRIKDGEETKIISVDYFVKGGKVVSAKTEYGDDWPKERWEERFARFARGSHKAEK